MIKDLKLGLGLGAGFWAIMFIGISALMVIPMPMILQQIGGIILAGVVGFLLAKIYFKKNPGDIKAGIILGVTWFIVLTVLDLLVTIQYVKAAGSYVDGLKSLYGAWNFWIGIVAMFVGIVVAVKLTHGGELMKRPSVQPSQPAPQQPPASPSPSGPATPPASQPGGQQEPQPPQAPPTPTPPAV